MNTTKPLFIVFEGIDGSGKSSQIGRLADYIRAHNKYQDVLLTREPTWRTSELREKLQDADAFSDGENMARLFVHDRAAHTSQQIIPELIQNTVVLCDRYAMSTCAYQLTQGVPLDKLLAHHDQARTLTPDMTLYFDVSREVAEERMCARGASREKFEQNETFTASLIANYQWLACQSIDNISIRNVIGQVHCIDGKQSMEKVSADVQSVFQAKYSSL